MKLELIKQIDKKGDIWYVVRQDGKNIEFFCGESRKYAAKEVFEKIKLKGIITESEEVIEQCEIPE